MKLLFNNKEIQNIVKQSELNHIAIIMDGNRRWAKLKNLPSSMGHKKGVEVLKSILQACDDFGIKYLTVYAFSTENWKRTKDEVKFLMDLLDNTMKSELQEMNEKNVRIKFIGNIGELSKKIQKTIFDAEEKTKNNCGVNLQIAFNYGSRAEIVNAVKSIVSKKIPVDKITEEIISQNLYTNSAPDPELLIRTGGEKRISNYLLWQIAYSEIIVVSEFWPEFNKDRFIDCIIEFQNRKRRFGK